jgi:hypothetical protein
LLRVENGVGGEQRFGVVRPEMDAKVDMSPFNA